MRVLVKDNGKREAGSVEDSTVECLKDLHRGGCVIEGVQMCVGGKAGHNDLDGCMAIRFVEGAGEVNG